MTGLGAAWVRVKVTMRVTESNGGKKVLLAPRCAPGFLLSPYSPGYHTSEVGEVVYSLAEKETDISTFPGPLLLQG